MQTQVWQNRYRTLRDVFWEAVPRAVALFFSLFSMLNFVGEFRHCGFDANIWWIDLSPLPTEIARGCLLLSAAVLLAFAVRPPIRRVSCWTVGLISGLLVLFSLGNAIAFYNLVLDRQISSAFPFPLSFLVMVGLLLIVARCCMAEPDWRAEVRPKRWIGIVIALMLIGLGIGFPMCQMVCFGRTDYRQQSDVAVVLGCRAYADGEPSAALYDRVRTGCLLYLDGTVRKLIFSGGPGDGDIHETESMRRLAVSLGVPDQDILLDAHGLSTQKTADNSARMFEEQSFRRVLVVSHFYHLPRIKLCFRRVGVDVRTVPCEETYVISNLGYCMSREVAALWLYYLRPLAE